MNTALQAAVATHLNISPNQIKSVEEWASVLFVRFTVGRPRFVSKKVTVKEYSNFGEFLEALDVLKLETWAGESIVSCQSVTIPAPSPFLPAQMSWKVTTTSGRELTLTNAERNALKEPKGAIKYVGSTYNQFADSKGFYQ